MSRDPAATLGEAARWQLETVLELLAEERASVSSVVDERAWQVHVLDSLTGLEVAELREATRIGDIGAGAGFPGLVLAAALPGAQVDLIESVGRKCEFMRRAIEAADLSNATVLNTRSEHWAAAEGQEAYDAVTARAVGRLSTLAELASPLLKPNGVLVVWKGKRDKEEEQQLANASDELAMHPEQILNVGDRAGSQHRHLHVIRKTGSTPSNLPRRPGIAKKRPKG
ncbi:MAG: 16S rRNA (guanine(527)-N(7))-methyltransferase RsmG [Solirubrobacterales bacterium]